MIAIKVMMFKNTTTGVDDPNTKVEESMPLSQPEKDKGI